MSSPLEHWHGKAVAVGAFNRMMDKQGACGRRLIDLFSDADYGLVYAWFLEGWRQANVQIAQEIAGEGNITNL